MTASASERLSAAVAGRYAVEREVGSGGMATVYLAQDLKHGRKVAIKVLRPDLAAALGTERFIREIEIAANLTHPHILPLFDSGQADGFLYYVMPYVEGESLRDRLNRESRLSVQDAIRLTDQIGSALAYAHDRGVVHRDIKPENILLAGDQAIVADFGIARAVEAAGRERLTGTGLAIGTPAYMSPEQAFGSHAVDGRTDVYALGCVVYEMVSGRVPFEGPTPQALLAKHAADTVPRLRTSDPDIPLFVERAVERALAKDPADRFPTAGAFAEALTTGTVVALVPPRPKPAWHLKPTRIAVMAAGVALLVAASVLSTIGVTGRDTEFVVGSTRQITSAPGLEIHPAISPDGKMVAYAAGGPGQFRIFVRPIAGGRAVMVTDPPEGLGGLGWSPDGTRITYLSPSGMHSVSVFGGQHMLLLRQTPERPRGDGALSPSGDRLAFVAYGEQSIYIANADGTNPKKIATSPARDYVHSLAWSPDGRFIAYVTGNPTFAYSDAIGNLAASTIWLVPTSGGAPLSITGDTHLNTSPVWTPDGRHVLFVSTLRGGRDVYSQRIGSRGEPRGAPQRLTTGLNAHTISVNSDGSLLSYATFVTTSNIWTLPIPRLGETTAESMRAVTTENHTIEHVSISPDHKWLAFDSNLRGNADIYKVPAGGGEPQQLTRDPADDFAPAWSPDGAEIAFHSFRKGNRDLYVMLADGSRVQEVVATPAQEQVVRWSADGTTLTYHGGDGIYVVKRRGGAGSEWESPTRVFTGDGRGAHPSWSPVVDSFAVATGEGLMVMSPDGGPARMVARTLGATEVARGLDWSLDGRTLYYSARDSSGTWGIWSVPASGGAGRRVVHFSDPARQLFRPRAMANDGKNFYLVIGSRESDIWVMDLSKK